MDELKYVRAFRKRLLRGIYFQQRKGEQIKVSRMWGVKYDNISDSEKRLKWCELIRSSIDCDKELIATLKKAVELLS